MKSELYFNNNTVLRTIKIKKEKYVENLEYLNLNGVMTNNNMFLY